MSQIGRRSFLQGIAATAGLGAGLTATAQDAGPGPKGPLVYAPPAGSGGWQGGLSPWPLTLNASTIRPAPVLEKVRVAAEAGWDGIELWINDLESHEADGGNLKDLGQLIRDQGLFVPNIIGLWDCMPAAPEAWEESLKATRERMRRAAEVGSRCVAAIPAPDRPDFDLKRGAEMYAELLRIGREDYGITVAFEFVGFLEGVHRLGQACAVALDANDRDACLVMDTFHLYRGGSGFNGLRHLDPGFIAVFHWNDLPAGREREALGDGDRVYPGDGMLPLGSVLRDLKAIGYTGPLSLEIFVREYWEMPAIDVAKAGLEKMRACITDAGVA